jgi:hypothetical protein
MTIMMERVGDLSRSLKASDEDGGADGMIGVGIVASESQSD